MRKKIAAAALIGGLGLTGGLLVGPGIASAADTDSGSGVSGRLSAIKDALRGLVADKTITQAQADKVAAALEKRAEERRAEGGQHGRGGFGRGDRLAEAAKVIGITPEALRTQLAAGKTLAQVAEANKLTRAALVDGLVKAAQARLATAVTDGRLTQAQADAIKSTLRGRISERVDRVGEGPRGPGRGRSHHGPDADGDEQRDPSSGTSVTPSSSQTA